MIVLIHICSDRACAVLILEKFEINNVMIFGEPIDFDVMAVHPDFERRFSDMGIKPLQSWHEPTWHTLKLSDWDGTAGGRC